MNFTKIFVVTKLQSLGHCGPSLHDPVFSHFDRTLTCDRQTGGWTDAGPQYIPC